jgi:hypothetical protein
VWVSAHVDVVLRGTVEKNRDRGARLGRKSRASLLCVAGLALTLGAASAFGSSSRQAIDGTLLGTSSWTPAQQYITGCDPLNPLTEVSIQGTYSASGLGNGTYEGTIVPTSEIVCPSIDTPGGPFGPGPPFTVGGSIVFTAPSGSFTAEIAPDSVGDAVVLVHSNSYEFELQLVVTEGTKRFANLSGTFTLSYGTTSDLLNGCGCIADGYGLLSGLFVHSPLAP